MDKVLIIGNASMMIYHHRRELIGALQANGYKVIVAALMDSESKNLVKIGCEFHPIKLEMRGTNIASDLSTFRSIVRLLKKVRPDIVLTFYTKTNIYGGIACRYLGIPYIENITGLGSALNREGTLQKIMLKLYRVALKNASTIFFQNTANRDFFMEHGFNLEQAVLIPGSGVNLDRFKPLPYPEEGKPVEILFVSRILKEKGIEEFLEAARRITGKHPEVKFHIAGPADNNYLAVLRKAERDGIITYHGLVHDTIPLMEKTHLTVLPSYYPEGMANVLLESSASARPVITTPNPGCADTMEEGVTGFLVKARDAESLTVAIERFISLDHSRQREMGLAARQKMEKEFDRETIIEAYLSAIRRAQKKGLKSVKNAF